MRDANLGGQVPADHLQLSSAASAATAHVLRLQPDQVPLCPLHQASPHNVGERLWDRLAYPFPRLEAKVRYVTARLNHTAILPGNSARGDKLPVLGTTRPGLAPEVTAEIIHPQSDVPFSQETPRL